MKNTSKDSRSEYQYNYAKENYDRINMYIPKGKKEIIQTFAERKGYKSINAYILAAIDKNISEYAEIHFKHISDDLKCATPIKPEFNEKVAIYINAPMGEIEEIGAMNESGELLISKEFRTSYRPDYSDTYDSYKEDISILLGLLNMPDILLFDAAQSITGLKAWGIDIPMTTNIIDVQRLVVARELMQNDPRRNIEVVPRTIQDLGNFKVEVTPFQYASEILRQYRLCTMLQEDK